jgi:glutamate-1-semialdehyde 2,1-aminomutase
MAAGCAVLDRLTRPRVYAQLEQTSRALADGLTAAAAEAGVPFTASAIGGMFGFFFHPGPVRNFADAKKADAGAFRRFFAAMLDAGVYLAPSAFEAGFVSLAHRPRDIATTLVAARAALHQCKPRAASRRRAKAIRVAAAR